MITNAQKTMLHIAKAKLLLSDDMYRSILREQAGVDSSLKLTNTGFDAVIRRLEELGFQNTARRRRWTRPEPKTLISAGQLDLINELFSQLGMDSAERQRGFCLRQCKRAWPQTRLEGNKVIEGLKAMIARRPKGTVNL